MHYLIGCLGIMCGFVAAIFVVSFVVYLLNGAH